MQTLDRTTADNPGTDREPNLRMDLRRIMAGEPPSRFPRPATVESWRRSLALGLQPDRFLLPGGGGIDVRSTLVRAATPVVDLLAADVARSEISVVLADVQGVVVLRRVPNQREGMRLDEVMLRPGCRWGLEHAGTNGLSDAIATGAPAWADGDEHFCDALTRLTTVGAPVHDPRTGHVIGALGLVCGTAAANSLLVPLVTRAAREIEQSLSNRQSGQGCRPVHRERVTFGWDSLTDAEHTVTELVSDGLTNRQVATKLYLSPHTVDAHLRHIFHKLGINSRVELVRIATARTVAALRPAAVAAVA
jgi:transcriptional regulator of acetoin/glycerol metabolism